MNKKLLVITDMDFRGSGYFYLMTPILNGLAKRGFDIKVIGLGYDGQEHNYNFSIMQCREFRESVAIAGNLINLWKPDLMVVGMDIPMQMALYEAVRQNHQIKYMAITPLENPPLTQSWVAALMQMDFTFFISEIGAKAAKRAGLSNVDYLDIGVDTKSYYPADTEERNLIREGVGYKKDEFILLTVADNQERKNLSAIFKAVCLLTHPTLTSEVYDLILSGRLDKRISDFDKSGKFRWVLVTRENSQVGHRIRDLALTLDINREVSVIERGISQEELRKLYVSSDLFILLSKAEGLGIPVLEAMACGVPVMATDTGAISKLLDDGRGILIPEVFGMTDVWGNSWRSFADVPLVVSKIKEMVESDLPLTAPNKAHIFIEEISLDDTVTKVENKINEITQVKS